MQDIAKFQTIALEAAKIGGKILKKFFSRSLDFRLKKNAGIVTLADQLSEQKIISFLKSKFPTHEILAEESGLHHKKSSFRWIIDPLDGTTNFAHHIPFFCTSIALEQEHRIIVAAVYDPIHENMYSASLGKGAYCNQKKIHVSKTKHLNRSLLATGFAYQKGSILKKEMSHWLPFLEQSHGIRRSGSAVWDLCQVACGHFDGFWERGLQPWDMAAGKLLIEEAGGKVSCYRGTSLSIYNQEIIASNGLIHPKILKILESP
ncbi:MAG: inositol monophosphatase [Deltaproteobacteria bacterium]|nr:inositol monophosphatase [Deltaproteobacteria bacterium]